MKNEKHKNIIIFGAPGAGKTTQIEMLGEAGLDFSLLSVGQLLRNEVKKETDIGKKIEKDIAAGSLADDRIVTQLVKEKLKKIDKNKIIVLDGYPRSLNQVEVVDELFEEYNLDLPIMIYIKISQDEAIKRLSKRRICSKCKENFSTDDIGDRKDCPKCGGELIQREDDIPRAIKTRFEIFDMQMEIVRHYFIKRNRYFEVDGGGTKEGTHEMIMKIVK